MPQSEGLLRLLIAGMAHIMAFGMILNACAAAYAAVQLKRVLMAKISLIVNGNPVNANVDPRTLLVQFLRENLRLTGTHVGCDTSQCGACVVHLDGKAVKSCTTLAVMADGHEVKTIEGLAADGAPLHPMQEAFREHHGLQCGFCTPGMIMTAVDLVHRKGHDLADHDHPRGARRQSVPLHRLPEHRRVDRRRRQGDGQIRPRLIDFIATAIRKFSMYEFKYHRPATVRQAANLLVKNEDAKVIAGGHTLVPVMKQRLASPPHLVDLSHIEGLDAHRDEGPFAGDRRDREARRRRDVGRSSAKRSRRWPNSPA